MIFQKLGFRMETLIKDSKIKTTFLLKSALVSLFQNKKILT